MHKFSPAVGILGGTFDPVHNAHLRIAGLALEALELGLVLWMPTGAPGYRSAPVAPAGDRLAMLRLALASEPRYAIDTRELAADATGYTVDSLAALRRIYGASLPLVLLMGADQFAKLDSWRRWRELFEQAHIAVFARPGWQLDAAGAPAAELDARRALARGVWRDRGGGAIIEVAMPPLDISATAVRQAIARGEDMGDMLPPEIVQYIDSRRLYRGQH